MPSSFELYAVRCFTCGKPIGHLERYYKDLRSIYPDISLEKIYDMLELDLYCCRVFFKNITNVYHNVEDKNVVDGIDPPDGGPSYIDKNDKISLQNEINKYKNLNSNFIKFEWDTDIEDNEKDKKIKPKVVKKKEFNLLEDDDLMELPEIEPLDNQNKEEEIDLDGLEINNYNDDEIFKIPIPKRPGFPIILDADNVLKNNNFKMITVGYESDNIHNEMKTKVLEGCIYLAE